MTNSDKFIDFYNKIDKFIKEENNFGKEVSFSYTIKESENSAVRRFEEELISLGELRNAIVHSPRFKNKVIAEPHEQTVARIIEIHEIITNPKKVIPAFGNMDIAGATKEEYINDILIQMRENSFSQFPVYDDKGHVCELINNNTISRWLASKLEDQEELLALDVKVDNLLLEIEYKHNYKIISRNTTIYKAYDMFIEHIDTKQRNLDALFITHSGKPTETLLGIITIQDIAGVI